MWEKLGALVDKYFGHDNVGDTPGNTGQCVGLIEVWLDALAEPHIPGNAVDLMANAKPLGYMLVTNQPMNFPRAGDIVCWNGTWGGGYGHCAIALAADDMFFSVLEQNDPEGSGVNIGTHDYSGVAGWIVPLIGH